MLEMFRYWRNASATGVAPAISSTLTTKGSGAKAGFTAGRSFASALPDGASMICTLIRRRG